EVERKLHYISRVEGEKVYDELDLKIAKFIIEKRNNKWSLNAIFDELPNNFELRPFPEDYENETKVNQVVDVEKMRATLLNEMKKLIPYRKEEKWNSINTIIAERKISRTLEEEALKLWEDKPAGERLRRIGLFRKEENKEKKDNFIKEYIDQHFEEKLKEE